MQKKTEWVDTLVDKVSDLFNQGNSSDDLSFKAQSRSNVRAVIQNALSNLDIVSRDEFDAQVSVLQRSREKIDALEEQLTALTEQLKQQRES
jgi:BMFP domain-containing protein YqiC